MVKLISKKKNEKFGYHKLREIIQITQNVLKYSLYCSEETDASKKKRR